MIKIFLYQNYKKILLVIIVVLGALIIYLKSSPQVQISTQSDNSNIINDCQKQNLGTIFIDIMGQVVNPGVYELKNNTLIIEAIEIAGGFGIDADLEYVHKNILLSATVKPSSKIYIPKIDEDLSQYSQIPLQAGTLSPTKINLNSANIESLKTINGVGDVTAEKIIELRPIKSYQELKNLKGVPSKTIDNIISSSEL